jgi:hypothetical protein
MQVTGSNCASQRLPSSLCPTTWSGGFFFKYPCRVLAKSRSPWAGLAEGRSSLGPVRNLSTRADLATGDRTLSTGVSQSSLTRGSRVMGSGCFPHSSPGTQWGMKAHTAVASQAILVLVGNKLFLSLPSSAKPWLRGPGQLVLATQASTKPFPDHLPHVGTVLSHSLHGS